MRISFLDYLRIFAFTSVLLGHKFYGYLVQFSSDQSIHATARFILSMFLPVIFGGGAGVMVFFLVSGYIITHVLQTESTSQFLIKRAFRIYPLYIVAVLVEYLLHSVENRASDFSSLIGNLLLVGDFFGVQYALNGVEWTLRVEVVFYVFMAFLRWFNFITIKKQMLPYIFIVATLMCGIFAPFPSNGTWSHGYFSLYAPFLFLGAMFYLYEKNQVGGLCLFGFISFVFIEYFVLISKFQPGWLNNHFAVLGFLVFFMSWRFRHYLVAAPLVLFLSDMTYAVYLFHNWFFDYAKLWLFKLNIYAFNQDVQALISVLFISFIMSKIIERPCVGFSRKLVKVRTTSAS